MIINLLHKAKLYTVPKNTSFSMSRPSGMYDSFCVLIIPQATALPLLEQLEWAWWHRTSAIASSHLPQITVKSAAHAVNNDLIKDKITVQTDTMQNARDSLEWSHCLQAQARMLPEKGRAQSHSWAKRGLSVEENAKVCFIHIIFG